MISKGNVVIGSDVWIGTGRLYYPVSQSAMVP